jgi:hypothetical protein
MNSLANRYTNLRREKRERKKNEKDGGGPGWEQKKLDGKTWHARPMQRKHTGTAQGASQLRDNSHGAFHSVPDVQARRM